VAEFIRLEDSLKDAILTIMRYVRRVTGVEPTQTEIVDSLTSYFILNELGNQITYQLKKSSQDADQNPIKYSAPFWTLNLKSGAGSNLLARAGVFHRSVLQAIQTIRDFMKKTSGVEPGVDVIAASLQSTFILSEIKNQIEWQRHNSQKKNTS
jgi:hypothetical protein